MKLQMIGQLTGQLFQNRDRTCEVNTGMKLKGSEGAIFTHEKHFIHVNDFKSTKSIRKFY